MHVYRVYANRGSCAVHTFLLRIVKKKMGKGAVFVRLLFDLSPDAA